VCVRVCVYVHCSSSRQAQGAVGVEDAQEMGAALECSPAVAAPCFCSSPCRVRFASFSLSLSESLAVFLKSKLIARSTHAPVPGKAGRVAHFEF